MLETTIAISKLAGGWHEQEEGSIHLHPEFSPFPDGRRPFKINGW
jgi:hypothetical protein